MIENQQQKIKEENDNLSNIQNEYKLLKVEEEELLEKININKTQMTQTLKGFYVYIYYYNCIYFIFCV